MCPIFIDMFRHRNSAIHWLWTKVRIVTPTYHVPRKSPLVALDIHCCDEGIPKHIFLAMGSEETHTHFYCTSSASV